MGGAFLLATVGFLVGIAPVLVGYRRRPVYLAGIPFTVARSLFWYPVNEPTAVDDLSVPEVVDTVALGC